MLDSQEIGKKIIQRTPNAIEKKVLICFVVLVFVAIYLDTTFRARFRWRNMQKMKFDCIKSFLIHSPESVTNKLLYATPPYFFRWNCINNGRKNFFFCPLFQSLINTSQSIPWPSWIAVFLMVHQFRRPLLPGFLWQKRNRISKFSFSSRTATNN